MIDLHRHLEGSVRYETWREIAREIGAPIIPKSRYRIGPREPKTLASFLSHFGPLHRLYPGREWIERVAREAVQDAGSDGVTYLELRFSPVHFARRMKADPVKVARWIIDAARKPTKIEVNFIITFSRDHTGADNEPSLRAAMEHRGPIVGIDLAGTESRAAPWAVGFVRRSRLPATIHAGEALGAASVRAAIEELGAVRIGHGVRAIEDPSVLSLIMERGVAFEMCPTSNVQTGACTMARHPLKSLLRAGQLVTINTDDPALSGITLSGEIALATKRWELSPADVALLQENAAQVAFRAK